MIGDNGVAKDVIKHSEIILKKEVFSNQPCFTIMFLIYLNKEIGFTELRYLLNLTPGNLDHHIRKLENAGYVKTKKKISWRPLNIIEITQKGSVAFKNYVVTLKKMLKTIE